MQRPITLPIASEHRLKRLQVWLAHWLAWIAAHALSLVAPEFAERCLSDFALAVRDVVVARALRRVRAPRPPHRPRCYDPLWRVRRVSARVIAGMRLKRALSGRTPAQRCQALRAVLRAAEHWVAHIARRLKRRFTKLRTPRHPAQPCAPLSAGAPVVAFADTS